MTNHTPNIYTLLEEWDLIDSQSNLSWYSKTRIHDFALELEKLYNGKIQPSVNRFHPGLYDAINAIERPGSLSTLGNPLMLSNQLILPDVIYSFLSPTASKTWNRFPWSGSTVLFKKPSVHTQWKGYWAPPIAERQKRLLDNFPKLREGMLKLRPLFEKGYIAFSPWELTLNAYEENIPELVQGLTKLPQIESGFEKIPQDQYSIGPRVGPMSIRTSSRFDKMEIGTPLWFADKTNFVLNGLFHSLRSSEYNATYFPLRQGDRFIHDSILAGEASPKILTFHEKFYLPDFSKVSWEDLLIIRQNEDAMEALRKILATATEVGDKEKIEYIRAELAKYSEKIQKDHTLSKITEKNFLSMVIGAFAGAAAGFALKKDPESALIGGLTGPAVTFLMNIINGLSSEARATAQVTSRVFLSLFP